MLLKKVRKRLLKVGFFNPAQSSPRLFSGQRVAQAITGPAHGFQST